MDRGASSGRHIWGCIRDRRIAWKMSLPETVPGSLTEEIKALTGYDGKINYLTNIMGLWMLQSIRIQMVPDRTMENCVNRLLA